LIPSHYRTGIAGASATDDFYKRQNALGEKMIDEIVGWLVMLLLATAPWGVIGLATVLWDAAQTPEPLTAMCGNCGGANAGRVLEGTALKRVA